MQSRRQSPPKHRHDGTSPLPLGMDWSPPPRRWNGRDTVWPHDPHSGWSYCVAIPSWVVLPKSRDSDPVVFYRVQVGIQSPEGVTTIHGVLRRFNDFLKLFADLRKAFPKKGLPPAPPKGLLRLKSRVLLEERRCSLEEWMTKLLSDIDLSRSVVVASFLELEAAARSSFQDANGNPSEASITEDGIPSFHNPSSSNHSLVAGSSSVASDNGSDTAYETSEIGTPSLGRHDSSEIGLEDLVLDEDLTGPIERFVKYGMSNIDEGLFMGQTILAQLEGFPNRKTDNKSSTRVTGKDVCNGNGPINSSLPGDGLGLFSESEQVKMVGHARKTSIDSVLSDLSSVRGSEISISGIPNSSGGGSHVTEGAEASSSMRVANFEFHPSHDAQILLPMDQRQKMNKVLLNMQQKLTTARTDMEDLIARLNQEMAVKDYLMTKVKDLEVELDTTKQKNKENLQQAILSERERTTKIQWEMEELRRKTVEMELKLHPDKDNKAIGQMSAKEEDMVMLELNNTKEQLGNLSKRYLELESKSKADIKVLVKEVKSLRNSQKELKQELTQSQTEKFNAEELLHRESESNQHVRRVAEKLMSECRDLHSQLLECNVDFLHNVNENQCMSSSSLKDASDILAMSDDKINLLLEEVERFRQNNRSSDGNIDYREHDNMPEIIATYDDLRKILAEIIISSMKLRKQVNSFIRCNIKTDNNVCFNPETEQSSQEDNLVKVGLNNND